MSRGRKLPGVLTLDEQKALLAQPNPKAPTGLRNLCMITVMLNAGLRVSEVINLQIRYIEWLSGQLTVRQGKGNKDRVLWLNEDDLTLLKEWRRIKPESKYLFCTLKGGKLDDRYIRQLVDRLANKAGIQDYKTSIDKNGKEYQESKVSPHTLRHTFATDLYRDTKNLLLVQKALGHSDISTTEIYTHIVDDELEDALKNFRRG